MVLLSVCLVIIILKAGSSLFIPLTFSLLLAILLLPASRLLEQRLKFGRSFGPIVTIILFLAGLSVFSYLLAIQFSGFAEDLPMLQIRFRILVADLQHWLSRRFHINTSDQNSYLQKSAASIMQSVAVFFTSVLSSLSVMMIWTVLILIFTFFILYYRNLLYKFAVRLFPPQQQENVRHVLFQTKRLIYGYMLALFMEMVIVCIANCTCLAVIGVKYALLLGMTAAVLNIIPYIGIYSSITLISIITFTNSTPGCALEAAAALFVIHLIDANFLMPRLVGKRVQVNPFAAIIAVIAGELLWDVPGMFLFIPVVGILKLIFEKVEGLEAWALLLGEEETPGVAAPTTTTTPEPAGYE
jgi:predicted PurR-regulated permease PerM